MSETGTPQAPFMHRSVLSVRSTLRAGPFPVSVAVWVCNRKLLVKPAPGLEGFTVRTNPYMLSISPKPVAPEGTIGKPENTQVTLPVNWPCESTLRDCGRSRSIMRPLILPDVMVRAGCRLIVTVSEERLGENLLMGGFCVGS